MKKYILTSIILLLAAVNTAWAQQYVDQITSLEAAIADANPGETIVLTADIDATAQIEVNKMVTLDLNGHILEYKGTSELKSGVIGVKRGGDLTITDSSNPSIGAIKSGSNAYAAIAMTTPGEIATGDPAKLTVEKGTLEGYYYAITGNGTRHGTEITINGGVIKGTYTDDNCGIFHPQDGTLTITGGKIEGYSTAVELRSGTLNITGGEFTATCETYSCVPNGSGTTTKGAAIAIAQHTTQLPIEVQIGSGTTFNVSGSAVKLSIANPQNNANYDVEVNGPTELLGESVKTPEGYAWKDNGNGTSSLAPAVAQIGTTGYATLKDAITKANAGETIELLANIDATAQILVDKEVTLDLNGKTIEYKGTSELKSGVIGVKRGGDLTITDSSSPSIGAIKSGSNAYAAVAMTIKGESEYGDAAKLTVESGTLEGYYYAITGNGTRHDTDITINGGVVKGTCTGDNCGIFHPQGGELYINGGTIKGYSSAVELRSGKMLIHGGTFTATCETYSCIPNGSGTTTKGAAIAIAQHTTQKGISVGIDGGTFNVSGDGVKLSVANPQNNPFKNVSVIAKTALFGESVIMPDGFGWNVYSNQDGTSALQSAVAKIGYTGYSTLKSAFDAATAGQTIILQENIDVKDQIFVDEKVTLDLNGKTVEYTGYTGASELKSGVIGVKRGGDLTIKDSSGTNAGTIKSGNKAYAAVAMTVPGEEATGDAAKLTVNSGTLEGYYYAITGNGTRHGTEITINGGVIKGTYTDDNYGIYHPQDGTLTITGGTIEGYSAAVELRSGTLSVSGGTFTATCPTYSCNPNGSGTTTKGAAIAIAQHTTNKAINAEITGGSFTVPNTDSSTAVKLSVANPQNNAFSNVTVKGLNTLIGESVKTPEGYAWKDNGDGTSSLALVVAKIGTTEYTSLAEAITEANAGETIVLTADIDATAQILVDKTVTLDLNGHTIEYKGTSELKSGVIGVKRGGDLTITDSSDPSTGAIKSGSNAYAAVAMTVPGEPATGDAAKLTVESGTLEGYYYAITGNGTRHGTAITINGGVVKGTYDSDNCGIFHPQDGTLTINGGTIEGYSTAVELRSGTLKITGGTFTATCPTYSCVPNGSGTTTKGAAIAIAQHTTQKAIAVTINGGTFIVSGYGVKLSIANPQNNAFDNVSVTSPTDLLGESIKTPEGYVWKDNGNGTSSLAPEHIVAMIRENIGTHNTPIWSYSYYATLEAAIAGADANKNQTIALLSDINLTNTITIDKPVTIQGVRNDEDGNGVEGKTVTIASGAAFEVTGNLNISFYKLNILANGSGGIAIQFGKEGNPYAGNITMNECNLTVKERGVSISKPGGKVSLFIYNTTIQSTVADPTTTYANNDTRGISIVTSNETQPNYVDLEFNNIKGFDYCVHVEGTGNIYEFHIRGGSYYGRVPIYNSSSNCTFYMYEHADVHGLNNETGSFACIVDNVGVDHNTYNIKTCKFTTTLSSDALSNDNASHYLLALRGTNATVNFTNKPTYTSNAPEGRQGLISNAELEEVFNGTNSINFHETAKTSLSNIVSSANLRKTGQDDYGYTYTLARTTVAKIGDVYYETLDAALAAANDNETIVMQADVDATAQILVNKKITLDLNGHTIEYKGTSELKSGVIGVKRGGDLTITDSSDPSTGAIKSGNKAYAAVAMTVPGEPATGDAAKLTVNSGTLEGYYYAITGNGTRHDTEITINGGVIQGTYDSDNCGIFHPQDGTLTITGGTISGYSAAVELRSGTLNISGGTFTATCETYSCEPNGSGTTTKGAAIAIAQHTTNKAIEANITGGTFNVSGNGVKLSVANPQNNAFSNVTVKGLNTLLGESVTVPEGYAWKDNGDGTSSLAHVVAKIGTASYASLKDAIADVPTDGTATTIELLTNINAEERTIIPSNTNITLDLRGFTLHCDDDFAIAFFDGAPGAVGPNKTQNAQLTVKGGTVTSKKSYAIRTDGTGNKLTIAEDATVKAGSETDYALVVRGSNTEVTVNGTVEVLSGTAISTNGNDATNNNSITINAPAKITSPDDDAIYMPSGALTVNGGTITGATGIYFKGKTLTIPTASTAVITGTGKQRAAHYNGNGGDWTGDALVVDNANYPSGDPVPSVAGGTFISTHALPIASYATGATATAPTKFVSGGRFGGKIPASVIVDNYICKMNDASGFYELEPGAYVAEVESIGYETFEEAVTAAGNEKVITLLADITGTYTMHEGQTLKIYKNGKNITVKAPEGSELKESEEEIDGKTVTVYAVPSSMGTLIAEDISLPLQVIPDNTHLKPSMLKDIEVTDGGKTLVLGVHYTVVVKDKSGSTTYTEDAPITDDGIYQAVFQGLAPYYSNSIAKEMPVLFEYNHFAAPTDDTYYNGNTSGYQIEKPVSIHVTSGKNMECQVGDKSGAALATEATSATLPAEATFILDNTTYKLKVVGIDNNAFDGAASIRYVDASAIKGFVPETLTREFDGPFKGLPKQALVFLAGSNIKGENYVYKPGGDAYYCELFKIYDDLNGSQTGFSGNDYKWAFENPHAFTAYTVENTRMLTAGKHYTTCLPYALAIPTSMKAYTLDATSNQIFGFKEVAGTMAAYTPYVLIPTASGQLLGTTNVVVSAFTATPSTDVTQLNGTTKGNFTMYGTMRYMEGNDAVGKYIMQYGMDHKPTWLSIDEAAAGFNESNRACILSMRAYIEATASPARSYTAVFTDIDGVIRTETFTPDEEDTVIYDLQGRRVQNVTHGRLYIINGKKVMVK